MASREIHPHRLAVAVHELGHWVVAKDASIRVLKVRLSGSGAGTNGLCRVRWPNDDDGALDHAYLLFWLAGCEAQRLHSEKTGTKLDTSGWSADLAKFKKVRRQHAPSRKWSESSLRADARRLVRAHWSEISRLAPRLAERGHL
ncbi:hypothetical protein SAMN05192558_113129 [Actinokineospora alba]|uniref:Peptidase family M41 n=1 Tax=Actinokineospora alba TaxID=504798 RepID=A0A1H0VA09_9PSEU|nr:M50 family metallopeptidase [Actinokineospora alba]TDP65576.1 hypothetical protein C8E96_1062 [Actinokineospora alba]SDH65854.1 hypothetical protein SAMN05421871_101883 [Actinokineospora alba]SDP75280.1 hypothetical protein SAMN05192558_113129 [Actinokineospora alba]